MYYFNHRKFSLLLVCITLVLSSYFTSANDSDEEIFRSRPKSPLQQLFRPKQKQALAKQFPNLSFALPGINLIQSRSNIFAKSTVTRTVLSTVATITAASFRTCTTSAAALTPCAGRRRRDLSGENELDGEGDDLKSIRQPLAVEATPSIKLIIDKTEIVDPASVAEILNERPAQQNYQIVDSVGSQNSEFDGVVETTTLGSNQVRNLDGTTTILYPSQDVPVTNSPLARDDEISADGEILADNNESGTTVETPYSDSIDTTVDSLHNVDDEEIGAKARIGVGQGGVVTVTSMIPITHVVQTAATGTSATLTIMYAGCLPPSVPVYGQQCTM